MKDIDNLIVEAKSVVGSANAERVGTLLIMLIEALEVMRDQVAGKGQELHQLRTNIYGSKSESMDKASQFAEGAAPLPSADDSGKSADEASQAISLTETERLHLANLNDTIREAKREARRLAGLASPEKKTKKSESPKPPDEVVSHPLPVDLQVTCPLCQENVIDGGKSFEALEIDVSPVKYLLRQHNLHKGSCPCGSLQLTMPAPTRGVPNTNFSPRFVAEVLFGKFIMHLPIHRQVMEMVSSGLHVSKGRINRLVMGAYEVLGPLVALVHEINRSQNYQQCDESPITTVIDKERKKQTLWCLVSGLAISYFITPNRNKETARKVIGGANPGVLTTDCLQIYKELLPAKVNSACLAHLRRKFWYCLPNFPLLAIKILRLIGEVYKIERRIKELTPKEKLEARNSETIPILDKMMDEMKSMDPPPKSGLGQAIAYATNHWEALIYFTKDGNVPPDNNICEGFLRGPKLGIKNYLFMQSTDGCEAAAGIYTIAATCTLHNIDFRAYLADVLAKLNSGWPKSQLEELLPWKWHAAEHEPKPTPIRRILKHSPDNVIKLTRARAKVARLQSNAKNTVEI